MISKLQVLTTSVIVIALLAGMAIFSPQTAQAATILVETTADELDGSPGNGDCSLREAVENANNDNDDQADCTAGSGADIILLTAGEYTLTGAPREDYNLSGDLDIKTDLTIVGADPMTTKIQGGTSSPIGGLCLDCVDRVLHVFEGAEVTLNNLTIRYGKAHDGTSVLYGSSGGGILNIGELTLNSCVVTLNQAGHGGENPSGNAKAPGGGGGIKTDGNLTVKDSRITYNRAGDGRAGGSGGYPSFGGTGGGISASFSTILSVSNTFIGYNQSGDGGAGGDSLDGDGVNGSNGGHGGGISCNSCSLTLLNSTVISNQTGDGGAGGASTGGDGNGGNGDTGGHGAGIHINGDGSYGIFLNTKILDNQTGQGGLGGSGSGIGVAGDDGERGSGGGMRIGLNADVTISKSAIYNNAAFDGAGISAHNDLRVSVVNSTISGNMADNNGGGVANTLNPTMELTFVTISNNTADYDGDGSGDGGGYYFSSYITVTNTIIAGNTSTSFDNHDCLGGLTSQDYNLIGISDSSGCNFIPQTHDQDGSTTAPLDPMIYALAFNGGLTPTHALYTGSPAVDQIPDGVNGCSSGVSRDQRGTLRIAPCDIGAYEIDQAYHVYLPLVLR